MCTYTLDIVFNTCFPIQIYRYTCTWFQIYYWFSYFHLCYWLLPVPVCLNHITWSCTRVTAWAFQLALSYILVGLLSDNPGPSCLDPRVWTVNLDSGDLALTDQSAQRKCGWAVVCPEPLFFQPPWSAREMLILFLVSIFQSFYIAYHAFALLDNLIFLGYCIMLCDNCVLVLLLLDWYYHCTSVL